MLKYDEKLFGLFRQPWNNVCIAGGGTVFLVALPPGAQLQLDDSTWVSTDPGSTGWKNISDMLIDTSAVTYWRDSLLTRPYKWVVADDTTRKPDEPVWAFVNNREWCKRHYAGQGKWFDDGHTSWSKKDHHYTPSGLMVLPNPDNPNEPPPRDWRPGA